MERETKQFPIELGQIATMIHKTLHRRLNTAIVDEFRLSKMVSSFRYV